MRTAIQQCCSQLKNKISKQQAAREQRLRKKNLTKYIPNVAAALFTVLQAVAERKEEPAGKTTRPGGGCGVAHRAVPQASALPLSVSGCSV